MPRQRIVEEHSELTQRFSIPSSYGAASRGQDFVQRITEQLQDGIVRKYLNMCREDGFNYILGGIEVVTGRDLGGDLIITANAKLYREAPRRDLEFRSEYLARWDDSAERTIQDNSFYPRNSNISRELGTVHPTPIQRVRQTVGNTSAECEDEPAEPITYPKINGAATKKHEPKNTLPWE